MARLLDDQLAHGMSRPSGALIRARLTAQIADQVLAGHELNLPSFAESAVLHESCVSALVDRHNRRSGEIETSICPIT